jgi:hypothetical protein
MALAWPVDRRGARGSRNNGTRAISGTILAVAAGLAVWAAIGNAPKRAADGRRERARLGV